MANFIFVDSNQTDGDSNSNVTVGILTATMIDTGIITSRSGSISIGNTTTVTGNLNVTGTIPKSVAFSIALGM
jgi:ethanolamine utilization microcompartment shell protein EutS